MHLIMAIILTHELFLVSYSDIKLWSCSYTTNTVEVITYCNNSERNDSEILTFLLRPWTYRVLTKESPFDRTFHSQIIRTRGLNRVGGRTSKLTGQIHSNKVQVLINIVWKVLGLFGNGYLFYGFVYYWHNICFFTSIESSLYLNLVTS